MERVKRVAAFGLLAYVWVGAKIGQSQTSFQPASVNPPFFQCDVADTNLPGLLEGMLGIVSFGDTVLTQGREFGGGFFAFVPPPVVFPPSSCPAAKAATKTDSANDRIGLTLGLNGNLYATRPAIHDVIQVDTTGCSTATSPCGQFVATLPGTAGIFAVGITVDPLSGDLFVTDPLSSLVLRVHPTGGSSVFATLPSNSGADGLAWSCDGSFLLVSAKSIDQVIRIDRSGNLVPSPFVQLPAGTAPDGIVFGAPGTPLEGFAFTNNNNTVDSSGTTHPGQASVTQIPLSSPSLFTTIASLGRRRGDLATVDNQGNLLVTQVDRIVRLATTNGGQWVLTGCSFCSNLQCAGSAATAPANSCITTGHAQTIQNMIRNICVNTNGDICSTLSQINSLIDFLQKQEPQSCTAALLLAATTLRNSLPPPPSRCAAN
jgi:hypothetical protein